MFTTIGTILLVAGIAGFFLPFEKLPTLNFLDSTRMRGALIFGGIFTIFGMNGLFFMADASTDYVLQYPWGGTKTYVNTNGVKPRLFAKVIEIDHEIIVKELVPSQYKRFESGSRVESENTYVLAAGDYEFNDFISSYIGSTVVITTAPDDLDAFQSLAVNSKSEEGLVYGRVVPIISAAKKNTAKLMSAQGYIAGRSSDYDKWFLDQLRNGTYELIEITDMPQVDSIGAQRTITSGAKTSSVRYEIKYEKGEPVRINEGLGRYGLNVRQADADDQEWEEVFLSRLQDLKDIVANTQKEIEAAQLAVERKKRIIEEGESNKAEERAKLEKEQIQQVIAAETRKLVESENLAAAEMAEKTAVVQARTQKTLADAEAYQNKLLVSAGLTPQERAQIEKETAVQVAKELAKIQLPSTYFAGGANSGSSDGILTQLIGAEFAKQLMVPSTNP
ncbi:MAG: hypothetical protein AAF564_20250 [Bacteroidota bacterium]